MPASSPPVPVTSLRADDVTPLLFTTNMGLEDVAAAEYTDRAAAQGMAVTGTDVEPFDLRSYARVTVAAPPEAALRTAGAMRSIHHVLAPLYVFDLPATDPLESIRETLRAVDVPAMEAADTFRVTTVRQGEHDFTSIDVQREAGAGLQRRYGTDVDLEVYDAEVRVDVHDRRCLVSEQHTREALSRRQLGGYQPRAALRANVAYALLRLAQVDAPPRVLLDPFCGSATILLEAAAMWPEVRLLGNDWHEEAVEGARANAAASDHAERIEIREGDAWHLADTFEGETVDLVVTNPPFGVRIGSTMDFFPFYRRVLEQLDALLAEDGKAVLLVLRNGPFNRAIAAVDRFDIRHVRVIETGGLYPRVFVIERR